MSPARVPRSSWEVEVDEVTYRFVEHRHGQIVRQIFDLVDDVNSGLNSRWEDNGVAWNWTPEELTEAQLDVWQGAGRVKALGQVIF